MKKWMIMALSAMLTVGAAAPQAVMADAVEGDTYVSLGADLTSAQRSTVLGLLDLTESDLSDSNVVTVTNKEEHEAYDSYLPQSVIGTKALSCAKVTAAKSGNGIQVTTKNITYCTTGMYQNALATAGVEDADVVVAGPVKLSGTAALLGVTKAYSKMSGKTLDASAVDTAADELVVTSDLGKETGDEEKAAQLIATVKNEVASGETDDDKISETIDQAAKELNINITAEQKQEIMDLMDKIKGLNLDVDSLKEQAKGIYEEIKNSGITISGLSDEEASSILDKIIAFFRNLVNQLLGNSSN